MRREVDEDVQRGRLDGQVPAVISVIIPARNAAETLPQQLEALACQAYGGAWEVIVADNGSADRTAEVAREWAGRIRALRVVDASDRPGASHARNVGAAAARGDFLVFCDADDRAAPRWLEAMAQAASSCVLAAGRLEHHVAYDGKQYIPEGEELQPLYGFLPSASSSNVGISKELLEEIAGWNEDYTSASGEDRDFCWRAQLAGYPCCYVPNAIMQKRDRQGLVAAARQSYDYGSALPKLYRDFRRHGMLRDDIGTVLIDWAKILLGTPYLLLGRRRRRIWVRLAALRWGRIVGSVKNRVLFL